MCKRSVGCLRPASSSTALARFKKGSTWSKRDLGRAGGLLRQGRPLEHLPDMSARGSDFDAVCCFRLGQSEGSCVGLAELGRKDH